MPEMSYFIIMGIIVFIGLLSGDQEAQMNILALLAIILLIVITLCKPITLTFKWIMQKTYR